MAKLLVPDDLWAAIAPLLPPDRPKPKGGRPSISDRAALTGILFVLRTGLSPEYLPAEIGCGSSMSCRRRLRDWQQAVGPSPTDRGEPGTKRYLVVGARGTPLGATLGGANRHDSMALAPTLDAIPPVRSGKGTARGGVRRSCTPTRLTDRRCRNKCRRRGIKPRIARRGTENSQKLGRHRWVVKRTYAWLVRFRRLAVRYERRTDTHLAFTTIGCALVCLKQAKRFW